MTQKEKKKKQATSESTEAICFTFTKTMKTHSTFSSPHSEDGKVPWHIRGEKKPTIIFYIFLHLYYRDKSVSLINIKKCISTE